MRSIGYCTYDPSASPRSKDFALSSQERSFADYCQRKGHNLLAVFADSQGESTRTSFTEMIQYIEREKTSFLVLVHRPEHLGMTLEKAVEAVLNVDRLGSQVVSTDDELPDPLKGLLKAFHSRDANAIRRQRIRTGMEAKALLSEGLGRPPYGYRIGSTRRLEEVPQETKLVRLIFRLYSEEGMGLRNIVAYLNQQGYLTRRLGNWSMSTVREILRNRVYIGTYARFGLRLPGSHPAIISTQEFRKVQDIMQARSPMRRSPVQTPFLLSGLINCSECGNRMIGITRRQSWRRKDGLRIRRVYRYYQCQSRTNQGMCGYQTWRAPTLEEKVVTELRQRMGAETLASAVGTFTADVAADNLPLRQATSRIANHRRRYLHYLGSAARGAITLRQLEIQLGRLANTQQSFLQSEVLLPKTTSDPSVQQNEDLLNRRKLLDTLLVGVQVSKSDVVLQFKTLTSNEAKL